MDRALDEQLNASIGMMFIRTRHVQEDAVASMTIAERD